MPIVDGIDYTAYGGYNALDFEALGGEYLSGATGSGYRIGKIGQRTVVVDPARRVTYIRGMFRVNSQLDPHVLGPGGTPQSGTSLSINRAAKYAGAGTTWQVATMARLRRFHYNAAGIHWQGGAGFDLPVVVLRNTGREAQLAATATRSGSGLSEPIKDIIKACRSANLAGQNFGWYGRSCGDWFDPKYKTYVDSSYGWGVPASTWFYQPGAAIWLHQDDGDYTSYFLGSGASNEGGHVVSGFGVPHTGIIALIGQLTGITSQTIYLSSTPNTYSIDTLNHTKTALIAFLTAKYGTIANLNASWGTGGYYTSFGTAAGGWGVGTGLADEDGLRPRTWLGVNAPVTTNHPVNTNELFDSTQWNPNVKLDLDNFYYKIVEAYLKPPTDRIKAIQPNVLWAGSTIGAGVGTRIPVLNAVAQYQDLAYGGGYSAGTGFLPAADRKPATDLMRSRMKTANPTVGYLGGRELPLIHTLYNPCGADGCLYYDNTNNALSQQAATQVARGQAHKALSIGAMTYKDPFEVYPFVGFMQWGYYDQPGEHRGWGIMSDNENPYDGRDYRVAQADVMAPDRTTRVEDRAYGDTLGFGGTKPYVLQRTDLIVGAHVEMKALIESQMSGAVPVADTTPPTAPGTITVPVIGDRTAQVQWVAATDPGSPASGIRHYLVGLRQTLVGGAYTVVATVTGVTTLLTNLEPETSYDLQIFAVDNAFPTNLVSATAATATFATIATSAEPVSYVGTAAALADTVTIPTHQATDVLLIGARRNNSAVAPTPPAGWIEIRSGNASGAVAGILAYKVAGSSSETSGQWLNASIVGVGVYRGVSAIGASAILTGGAGANAVMPAVPLQVTDGSSWVVGFNVRATASGAEPTAVTGMTLRSELTSGTPRGALLDTDGPVSVWNAAATDIGNAGWVNIAVELISGTAELPDPLAPTVAIAAPAAAATISGVVPLELALGDLNGSGIIKAEFYVDDVLTETFNPTTTTLQFDTTLVTEASHVLHVVVTDTLGLTGTSADVTVTVDQPADVTTRRAQFSWFELEMPDPPGPVSGTVKATIKWDRGPLSVAYQVTQDGDIVAGAIPQVPIGQQPSYDATAAIGASVQYEIRHIFADGTLSPPLVQKWRHIRAAPTGFQVTEEVFTE